MAEHNRHEDWDYETSRFRLLTLIGLAIAGAAAIALAYGLAYFLYHSQVKDHRTQIPSVFPAPQLAIADDRSADWREHKQAPLAEAELAIVRQRVLSRGSAAYDPPEAGQ